MKLLGISAYYHDSAAALIEAGEVVAAAQEERFSRIKNDAAFPAQAIRFCLESNQLKLNELDAIVFYDKPFLKFERLIESYFSNAPRSWISFVNAMPVWLKEKLFLKSNLKKELLKIDPGIDWKKTEILFSQHHLSHSASSFFASPFEDSAILTIDGVGEWATSTIAHGKGNQIQTLKEIHFPDSIGLFYSAMTYFLGFEVNSGEYKVMGLAPYARADDVLVRSYLEIMKREMIEISDDGAIRLNQQYFRYTTSLRMIHDQQVESLLKLKRRKKDEPILKAHYCIAQATQLITEEVVFNMARHAKEITQSENLCLAGGVALNCVINGKLVESGLFKQVYVQPAAGDSGGALGAAIAAQFLHFNRERKINPAKDWMKQAKLGPEYDQLEIRRELERVNLEYTLLSNEECIHQTLDLLQQGKAIGLFQGKMEFGPRALGSRSIIGNPLLPDMQTKLNLQVKKRESFRPFAPILLQEEFEHYFGLETSSPFMLSVHSLLPEFRISPQEASDDIHQMIRQERSPFPAVTHVDYSSRIQTVSKENNPFLFDLLHGFKQRTGFGILVNTSFNLKDEPIVCSPKDAIECFLKSGIDCLLIENYLVLKNQA